MTRIFNLVASDRAALVVDDETFDYAWLLRALDDLGAVLSRRPGGSLLTIVGDRSPSSLLGYLAALDSGLAVSWLGPDPAPTTFAAHLAAFRPDYVLMERGSTIGAEDYRRERWAVADGRIDLDVLVRKPSTLPEPTAPTALLLPTSGSTGGPRYVRLSRAAVEANAAAIAAALHLTGDVRAATSLPLHYTYGLSVVNSTLTSGGCLVLTSSPPTGLAFWQQVARHAVTAVACVPFHIETILARQPALLRRPGLRLVTVAGGALAPHLVAAAATILAETGAGLSPMYGLTEATARVSVLPAAEALTRPDCAGRPVPGTSVRVEDEHGGPVPDGQVGRIVVRGPSVMLGYATSRRDLAEPDHCRGVLVTADRGYLRNGYVYLRGRGDRVVKLAGRRVELDDLERLYADLGTVAAVVAPEQRAAVFVEGVPDDRLRERHLQVCRQLQVTTGTVIARPVPQLPRLTSGKVDYPALAASIGPSGGRA